MSGNIGSFAGGLADGYMRGEDMKLRQRNQDNQDKRAAREDEEYAAKTAERERQVKFRTDYSALQAKYYGEQDAEAPPAGGNVAPGAQPAKVKFQPGQDPNRDAQFLIDSVALKMRYADNPDPEAMFKASQYVQTVKQTEVGRLMLGALSGDKAALIKLGQSQGFDGASAKLVTDPAKGVFKLITSAGEQDLMPMAHYLGADLAYKQMKESTEMARGTESHELGVKKINADLEQIPLKGNLIKAQTNAANASAARSAALARNTGSGGSKTASKDVLSAVKAFTPNGADGKPDSGAGALIAHIAVTAHGGKKPTEAASAAAMEYSAIAQGADQWIKGLSKEQRKTLAAQAGGDLRGVAIAKMIQKKYSQSQPATGAGNIAPADDTEE